MGFRVLAGRGFRVYGAEGLGLELGGAAGYWEDLWGLRSFRDVAFGSSVPVACSGA